MLFKQLHISETELECIKEILDGQFVFTGQSSDAAKFEIANFLEQRGVRIVKDDFSEEKNKYYRGAVYLLALLFVERKITLPDIHYDEFHVARLLELGVISKHDLDQKNIDQNTYDRLTNQVPEWEIDPTQPTDNYVKSSVIFFPEKKSELNHQPEQNRQRWNNEFSGEKSSTSSKQKKI